MAQHPLGMTLAMILLAIGPVNSASGENANDTQIQEKKIEERTAGLLVRQPEEEDAWRKTLQNATEQAEAQASAALARAKEAVKEASGQAPLVDTYTRDIWAKVKQEFEQKGLEYDETYIEKLTEQNREDGPYEKTHLFVFVSESVPMLTLRNYQRAFEGVPVTFVIRGLIGDDPSKFQPTQVWANTFLCREPPYEAGAKCYLNPVDVNPNLFRAFDITSVPAVMYVQDPLLIETCGSSPLDDEQFLLWYGDMAPAYVLEQFSKARPLDFTLAKLADQVR